MKKEYKPSAQEIKDFVGNSVFQWFLGKVVLKLNEIDTVRDCDLSNPNLMYARRLAIESIEEIFSDIISAKKIIIEQKIKAEGEVSTTTILKENKDEEEERKNEGSDY